MREKNRKSLSLSFLLGILCLFLGGTPAAWADYISQEKALALAKSQKLRLPKPEKDGRYQTFNKRGAATPETNTILDDFITDVAHDKKRVLQLEGAFGHVTLRAIEAGVHDFIVTDSDPRHLAVIARRLSTILLDNQKALKLFHGTFPRDFKSFDSNTFDTILLNRVIHFMTPQETTTTLKEVFRLLKPGGKVFIVAITPYVKRFETFIPLYKKRLLLKYDHPGYVKNLRYFANPEVTTPEQMTQMHDKPFMFFDAQSLHRTLSESGFIIEKALEFPLGFTSDTWELDGREFVGAIAKKPKRRHSFPTLRDK